MIGARSGQQRVHHVREGPVDEPGPGAHPGHRPGQPDGEGGLQREGDPEPGLGDEAGPGRWLGHPLVRGLRRGAAHQHVGPESVHRLDLVGQRLGGERAAVAADRGPGPAGPGEFGHCATVAGQQGDPDRYVGSTGRRERRQRVAEGASQGPAADDRDVPGRHRGSADARSHASDRIVTWNIACTPPPTDKRTPAPLRTASTNSHESNRSHDIAAGDTAMESRTQEVHRRDSPPEWAWPAIPVGSIHGPRSAIDGLTSSDRTMPGSFAEDFRD